MSAPRGIRLLESNSSRSACGTFASTYGHNTSCVSGIMRGMARQHSWNLFPDPHGQGKRFQECCLAIPLMMPLTQDVLWPYVLANVPQAERDELLSSSRIPRAALIEFAAHLLEMRRSGEV